MKKLFKLYSKAQMKEEGEELFSYSLLAVEKFDALMSIIHCTDQFYTLKRTIDFGEQLLSDEKINQYQLKYIARSLIEALKIRADILSGSNKNLLFHKSLNDAIDDYTKIIKLWEKAEVEPDIKIYTNRCELFIQEEEWDNALSDAQNIKILDCRKGNYYLSLIYHRMGDEISALNFLKDGFDCDHDQQNEWMEFHKLSSEITTHHHLVNRLHLLEIMLKYKMGEREFKGIDLSFVEISGNFTGADFTGANFECALFSDTCFDECNLSNASLKNSMTKEYSKVSFIESDLSNANLENACIPNAHFRQANLYKTNLNRATITNADFSDATFKLVSAINGCFNSSSFSNSNIENTIFTESTLSNTNFEEAKITSSKFDNARIIDANLNNITFIMTSFIGAELRDVMMKNVNFSEISLEGATINRLNIAGAIDFSVDFFEKVEYSISNLYGVPPATCLEYYESLESNSLDYLFNNYQDIDASVGEYQSNKEFRSFEIKLKRKLIRKAKRILAKKYHQKVPLHPYSKNKPNDVKQNLQEPGFIDLIKTRFVDQDYLSIIHDLESLPLHKMINIENFENRNRFHQILMFLLWRFFGRDYQNQVSFVDDELERLIWIKAKINEIKLNLQHIESN